MRAIFKFSKGGGAQYISHLDLMRAMNRAIRRAGLPAQYSQGFHPHIVMSFAQALGLGYLSQGEYMEITLPDGHSLPDALERLNASLPNGIRMTGAWALDDGFPTLMAAVTAARWRVELTEGVSSESFAGLMARESIPAVKQGKNGPAHVDIRPGIFEVEKLPGGTELLLAAGSALNIRPELTVTAALGGCDAVKSLTRLELYTTVDGRLTPLYQICIGESNEYGKAHTG